MTTALTVNWFGCGCAGRVSGRYASGVTTAARTLLAVALGGATGSLLRWVVDLLLPVTPGSVPWGTLLVNVFGSAVLGAVVVVLDSGVGSGVHRAFFATGVLGGFTTFSTYTMQVILLTDAAPAVALTYLVATPLLCVTGAGLAATLVRQLWNLP
ncbi:fluoride efflux transporter FluC [Ornithinimicrobium sufpigmenti]|uniref:fluoride efflux transporter FluC n=1 Tax=Ornithinimicrobium sufpigmenti TaxID=2508882 RepID=UPI00103648BB|nr:MULTISPECIES: CrcB family protein [unclassified Ornithinimicrobium]